MEMDSKKVEAAMLEVRMALSGKRKYSLYYLGVIRKACVECNFSEKILNGIDAKIDEAKKVFDSCCVQIEELIKKGLEENAPIACKKCFSKKYHGCDTSVSRILKASVEIFCNKDKQTVFVKPSEFRLLHSCR